MVAPPPGSGPDVPVVTELLPTPADAWVPDAAGRGYVCELRLHPTRTRRERRLPSPTVEPPRP